MQYISHCKKTIVRYKRHSMMDNVYTVVSVPRSTCFVKSRTCFFLEKLYNPWNCCQ